MTAIDQVSPQAVDRFVATIDRAGSGDGLAPPGFHWCLGLPDTPTAELDRDGHPRRGAFLPPIELPRRMWVASDIAFLAPLAIGAAIERRSTIAAISEKQGSSGLLAFVEIDHVLLAEGQEAIRERQTIVYREAAGPATSPQAAAAAPAPEPGEWQWRRSVETSEPLLFRYSALTFNSHRIHYDQRYATQVEHYPGLVVQGPLTATLLIDLADRHLDGGAELAGFAFKARSPAFAGETLELVARPAGDGLELAALGSDSRRIMSASATLRQRR